MLKKVLSKAETDLASTKADLARAKAGLAKTKAAFGLGERKEGRWKQQRPEKS